jgi:hypothetical protein
MPPVGNLASRCAAFGAGCGPRAVPVEPAAPGPGVLSMKMVATLLSALVAVPACWQPARAADERLVYTMEVTAEGTRSQGWLGTLYDEAGNPMAVPPGWTVTTGAGTFVSVACVVLFHPCGMIDTDMRAWMSTGGGNDLGIAGHWAYRLTVSAEGTRDEGWRGELLRDAVPVAAPTDRVPVATPWGPFRWWQGDGPWGRHGWFHASWVNGAEGSD